MNARFAAIALILAVILATGCAKSREWAPSSGSAVPAPSTAAGATSATSPVAQAAGSDADAVRAAIEDHLRNDHSINMAVMDVSIDSISIHADQAQASAAFHLKQGGTGMAMSYFLRRHANGWLVIRSQPSDGQFVHPPMDKVHSGMASSTPPAIPDVTDFLKNQPAPKSNGTPGMP